MGAGRPLLWRIAGDASLFFILSSLAVAPVRAALATTCYLELGSKLLIGSSDLACGVVNDTSVGDAPSLKIGGFLKAQVHGD
jgi:hypothetical protein